MSTRRWLTNWIRPAVTNPIRRRKATRLGFVSLEDRVVPATLFVDNTAFGAAGPGLGTFTPTGGDHTAVSGLTLGTDLFTTISSAVAAAAPGDTINVADGTFAEQVNASKASLNLRGNQYLSDGQDL